MIFSFIVWSWKTIFNDASNTWQAYQSNLDNKINLCVQLTSINFTIPQDGKSLFERTTDCAQLLKTKENRLIVILFATE